MSVSSRSSDVSPADLLSQYDAALTSFKQLRTEFARRLKMGKPKVKKDPAAAPEAPKSAWVAWTALVTGKYASAYAEHIAGLPVNAKTGKPATTDVMGFASKCRKELFVDDWNEHERIWESAHETKSATKPAKSVKAKPDPPASNSSASAPSMVEELAALEEETKSVKSTKSAKKLPVALPAPKPIVTKKAAAKKAAEPSEDAKATAEQWKNKGKVYMKNVDNQVWQFDDGSAGDYVGFFDGSKIIKGALAAE
jgi:hypothetical protein